MGGGQKEHESSVYVLQGRIPPKTRRAGMNCLYKINKLNRFSEDLDFTLAKKIDIEKLANKILANLMLLNIKGKIKEINKYDREINVRLLLNGPLYRRVKEAQCYIPLNISLREQPAYEPNKVNFRMIFIGYWLE